MNTVPGGLMYMENTVMSFYTSIPKGVAFLLLEINMDYDMKKKGYRPDTLVALGLSNPRVASRVT